jgi:hypothetical protein
MVIEFSPQNLGGYFYLPSAKAYDAHHVYSWQTLGTA